jgi:hypothetical protein
MADPEAAAAASARSASARGSFDKQKFGKHLRDNALPPYGKGRCAEYVRKAMEAAGLQTGGRPNWAKNYGTFLVSAGFSEIFKDQHAPDAPAGYTPQAGDIVVLDGTSKSKEGHIEGYDGTNWISDFVQKDMWAGPSWRSEKASYAIYRR